MSKKVILLMVFFMCFSSMTVHIAANQKTDDDISNKLKQDVLDTTKKLLEGGKIEIDEEETPSKKENLKIDSDLTCTKNIKYTVAQKRQLDLIYHRIYMDYIALIETYAWSGALTQDQKLLRYKMLKNYILTFQKRNYKWCSEYEEDEWEEEWFNNDND